LEEKWNEQSRNQQPQSIAGKSGIKEGLTAQFFGESHHLLIRVMAIIALFDYCTRPDCF
jgi:hypothetical protein